MRGTPNGMRFPSMPMLPGTPRVCENLNYQTCDAGSCSGTPPRMRGTARWKRSGAWEHPRVCEGTFWLTHRRFIRRQTHPCGEHLSRLLWPYMRCTGNTPAYAGNTSVDYWSPIVMLGNTHILRTPMPGVLGRRAGALPRVEVAHSE